jgi:glycosyltransferase involved in cell wall biosynthesis
VRILYVLTSLGVGGAEKQAIALAERMAARGHAVALIALKHTEEEWPVKLPVLRLNLKKTPLGILRGLQFARKFLTLFRPDILHSHTFPANIFTRLLHLPFTMRGRAPIVVNTIHNVYEGGWHRMLIYQLTRLKAHFVTAVSAAAAERFIHARAVSKNKMQVLTNGIETEAFDPERGRRRRVRSQMKTGDAFVWLAAGRLAPAKDYPNLVRAWAQVQSMHPKAQLWIAGEGDISALAQEGKGAASEDHGSSVHWLGLRRDVADLMDAADGYVLSSAWEGMPLALGEAMAMEKVAVATDVGGVRELIGDAGFVVPPNDSKALADEMLNVMAMAEPARRVMGRDARLRIKLNFSIDAKAEEWERLYSRLNKPEPM